MTIIIGIFQFHCKSEHKQAKWNKIEQDICKSDSISPYLQGSEISIYNTFEIYFLRAKFLTELYIWWIKIN